MALTLAEKCQAIGIGSGIGIGGYPRVMDRILKKEKGVLKAYFREGLGADATLIEDKDFDPTVLQKIIHIENDALNKLTAQEQEAISSFESAATDKEETPDLVDVWKKVKEIDDRTLAQAK